VPGLDDVVNADQCQHREQHQRDHNIDRRIAVEIGKQQDRRDHDDGREDEETRRQRQQQGLHEPTPRIGRNKCGESNPSLELLRSIEGELVGLMRFSPGLRQPYPSTGLRNSCRVAAKRPAKWGNRMKPGRRGFLTLAAGAAGLAAAPGMVRADTYPSRPIRLVLPFPPGGVFDIVGRPWADKVGKSGMLGTVFVENLPGAGGSLAAAAVAHASPDGYSVFLGSTALHLIDMILR